MSEIINPINGTPQTGPQVVVVPQVRYWSTGLFECLKDEESCWWGTWCCCLLSARTSETFGVGLSSKEMWAIACGLAVVWLLFFLPPLPIIGLVLGLIFYAYFRGKVRGEIRGKLGIPGTLCSDCIVHHYLPCCTACQEAREAKANNLPRLDFCYAVNLDSLEVERANQEGSWQTVLNSISPTSSLILKICLSLMLIAIVVLGMFKPENIAVLLLVFVQPVIVLYFLYWRNRRRYVLLDYVIKCFAVGFFMATTQSMFFESVFEFILMIIVNIALAIESKNESSQILSAGSMMANNKTPSVTYKIAEYFFKCYSPMTQYLVGPTELYSSHNNNNYNIDTSSTMTDSFTRMLADSNDGSESEGNSPADYRHHIVILVLALFVMAFIIAAGVEETMKHFVVRCCRFPAPLKDPNSVLVYLMVGALGFATAENIEYVFGTNKSPLPGTSLFVGEVFVLVIRVLMPIHLICSVLQASTLSKVLMGQSTMSIFNMLLPAIILHGTFDFFLFLTGALQYAYDIESTGYEVFTFIMPFIITIAGIVYARQSFQKVLDTFEGGWQRFSNTEDEVVVNFV